MPKKYTESELEVSSLIIEHLREKEINLTGLERKLSIPHGSLSRAVKNGTPISPKHHNVLVEELDLVSKAYLEVSDSEIKDYFRTHPSLNEDAFEKEFKLPRSLIYHFMTNNAPLADYRNEVIKGISKYGFEYA
jgi:hypothetical protein